MSNSTNSGENMKLLRSLYIALAAIICLSTYAGADIMPIISKDFSNFPEVKVKLNIIKDDNTGVNFYPSLFQVFENNTERTVLEAHCEPCPPEGDPVYLSITFVLDISGSMELNGYLDLAKSSIKKYMDLLKLINPEYSLVTFNNNSYVNQDFTHNRALISKALDNLSANGGTDYNNAFLSTGTGGLNIAKNAKYQNFVIFITDGLSESPTDATAIIDEANKIGAKVSCITLGMDAPQELFTIAEATEGHCYEGIDTFNEFIDIYFKLLNIEATGSSKSCECYIVYESGADCVKEREVWINVSSLGLARTFKYNAPAAWEPQLKFEPNSIKFGEVEPNTTDTKKITISAVNIPIEVKGLTTTDPTHFKILGETSFTVEPGKPKEISVMFTPTDSLFRVATFDLESSACNSIFSVSGGYKSNISTTPTLEVVQPNGSEKLVVGSEYNIKWKGILPEDNVSLEYSIDEGKQWTEIEKSTNGLEYNWAVPNTPSEKCLARVKQQPDSTLPELLWMKQLIPGYTYDADIIPKSPGASTVGHLMITSGGQDTKITIWDMDNINQKKIVKQIDVEEHGYKKVILNQKNRIFAYSTTALNYFNYYNNRIQVIDWETESVLYTLPGWTNDIAFSNDGSILAVSFYDRQFGYIILYDALTGQKIKTLGTNDDWHVGQVFKIGFSKDDSKIVSFAEKNVKVWDTQTGSVIGEIYDDAVIQNLQISYEHNIIAYCTHKSIKLFDFSSLSPKKVIDQTYCGYFAIRPDKNEIAYVNLNNDSKCQILDFETGSIIKALELKGYKHFYDIIYNYNGNYFVTCSNDHGADIYDANYNSITKLTNSSMDIVTDFEFSDDESKILVCSENYEKAFLINSSDGSKISEFDAEMGIFSVACSKSGETIALAGYADNKMYFKFFDVKTRTLLTTLPNIIESSGNMDMMFVDNDKIIITGSGRPKLIDWKKGIVVRTFGKQPKIISDIELSKDSRWLLLAGINQEGVSLFDFNSGDLIRQYDGGMSAHFDNDASQILTSKYGYKTSTIDVSTGESKFEVIGVDAFFVSDDSKIINQYNNGNTLQIIDAENGTILNSFTGAVDAFAFHTLPKTKTIDHSSKNFYMGVAPNNGRFYLYKLNTEAIQKDISDDLWSIVSPEISVSSDLIDMHDVLVSKSKDSVVVALITNTGITDYTVSDIKIEGGDFDNFSIVSGGAPFTLAPNEKRNVEFRFSPKTIGFKESTVRISSEFETKDIRIIGNGINSEIELVSDLIDLGKEYVKSQKDTIVEAIIKNTGTSKLIFEDCKLTGPDLDQISILNGGGKFELEPNATHSIEFRFAPVRVGKTSSMLTFIPQGLPLTEIKVIAEAIQKQPSASITSTDPKVMVCNSQDSILIVFANTGEGSLSIHSANITGINSEIFYFDPDFEPIEIEPQMKDSIWVRYQTSDAGTFSADITFFTNDPDNPVFVVPIEVKKENIMLEASTYDIDLGKLCPNETIDSTITITNSSSIALGAEIIKEGNILSEIEGFKFAEGENKNLEFSFVGQDNKGYQEARISIRDSICDQLINIKLHAIIVKPEIETEEIVVNMPGSSNVQKKIIIKNISDETVSISNIILPSNNITIVSPDLPIDIVSNGSAEVILECSIEIEKDFTGQVTFELSPCSVRFEEDIRINYTGDSKTRLVVGEGSAKPGETVDIPVYLYIDNDLELSENMIIRTTLNYNATLLYPDTDIPGDVINGMRKTQYEFMYADRQEDQIGTISFIAMNGNAVETAIMIISEETEFIGNNLEAEYIDGKFIMTGLCNEGGPRLIADGEGAVQALVSPNPSSGIVDFTINIIEKSPYELALFNIVGDKVAVIRKGIDEPGIYHTLFNTEDLPNGQYFYRLETLKGQFAKIIVILN